MVELLERRVTRSLSNELQTRPAMAQGQAHLAHVQAQPQFQHSHSHSRSPRANSNALTNRADSDGFTFEPQSYFRTTSEEILIRTIVDGAITQSNPSMDGLGLSNLPLASRRNSEELFTSWLSNQEGPGATASPYRTRQVSRRISNDISFANPQHGPGSLQMVNNYEQHGLHTNCFPVDTFGDQSRLRDEAGEKSLATRVELPSLQGLPWLQQSQPMTRSRSAELRRMYAAMQGLPSLPSADTLQRLATQGTHGLNQAVASLGAFARGLANGRVPHTPQAMQYPQSSNAVPPIGSGNSISNMVSMLKGSLDHKKLDEMIERTQNTTVRVSTVHGAVSGELDPQIFSGPSENTPTDVHDKDRSLKMGGIASSGQPHSPILTSPVSPSESSGGAPSLSAGVALSDGPSNSGTVSTQHNDLKRAVQGGRTVEQPSKKLNHGGNSPTRSSHRSGDCPFEGFRKASQGKKPEQLTRAGSLLSSGRSGLGLESNNPTKMRRVERREKMLEAKGRPILPSDLQVAIKRCDALEKEVRSLKLTVSFMNRKDSEQTKRIEELEKENQELQQEKERLLEEVMRLASGHNYRRL